MSYEIPEEQIAEDFSAALADLSMNSRYEISNLTLIARENTASALAISEALKTHIKQVGSVYPLHLLNLPLESLYHMMHFLI